MTSLLWIIASCGLFQGEFTEGPEIVCEDPTLREEVPMDAWSLGEGWDTVADNEGTQLGGSGLLVADLTGDGRLDVLVPNAGMEALFVAQADGSFVDEAASRWDRDPTAIDTGATAADHDGDGDLDV